MIRRFWTSILAAVLPGRAAWRDRMAFQRDEARTAVAALRRKPRQNFIEAELIRARQERMRHGRS